MTIDYAIFASTPQALHVSFLILSQPAMEVTQLRSALIWAMESQRGLTARQRLWLDQLHGERSATVYFDGLYMLEVRGQCAMIVAAAKDRLPLGERAAVLARYGADADKARGILQLAKYARGRCGITASSVLLALVTRQYVPRKHGGGASIRDLADDLKVDRNKLFRAARWMQVHFGALEAMATDRLHRIFVRDGVVEVDVAESCDVAGRAALAVRRTSQRIAKPRKAERAILA